MLQSQRPKNRRIKNGGYHDRIWLRRKYEDTALLVFYHARARVNVFSSMLAFGLLHLQQQAALQAVREILMRAGCIATDGPMMELHFSNALQDFRRRQQ